MQRFLRRVLGVAIVSLAACGGGADAPTSSGTEGAAASAEASQAPSSLQRLAIAGAAPRQSVIDARLAKRRGPVDVWVSLDEPSVAALKSARLEAQGIDSQVRALSSAARESAVAAERSMAGSLRAHRDVLRAAQSSLIGQLQGMGARELGRVVVAHNAVAVQVDASSLQAIARLPGVAKVRPVLHYTPALAETVPYVGAAAAQAAGKDGTGVRVAVIDSGIDYTHRNLGGPGTAAAFALAYGTSTSDPRNTTRDGLFPTAKVVDGFDFVGDAWPDGPRTEDNDPIDLQGHGTHIADIIAGRSTDGLHKGVAPGASLVAIKACSTVAIRCNGVALLRAMDFALDPNGDGDTSDAVDVINLSLGTAYGQEEDDFSFATASAVRLGVVVVAAAGNSANRPFIVSSPSEAPGVISVAQTVVPSDKVYPLVVNSPAAIAGTYANTATVDFAPLGSGFSGTVAVVGQGCPADDYLESPAGKVALIDRGACAVSLKVDRAARAGATAVLIGLIAAGDAVSFSHDGGTQFVPTLVIQQSLSGAIQANRAAPVQVTVSGMGIPLIGSMVGTSSRGPGLSRSDIKPEIGAPGGSVSVVAGSGNGEKAFGGTSGATPMVAGAAAILVQAFPSLSPEQIKALLMNSAETQVFTQSALFPGQLAPITRIGAGELRVNRALGLTSLARDRRAKSAALSFGYESVAGVTVLEKRLLIENLGHTPKTFSVRRSFRYANDEASGAVRIVVPLRVWVGARSREEVTVSMIIDGSRLPAWGLDGGPNGGNGPLLEGNEFDGYLTLTGGSDTLSVPWHVLPRKAGDMKVDDKSLRAGQNIRVRNNGIGTGGVDVFSLTGVSPRADRSDLPQPGDAFAFVDMRAVGVRILERRFLQFAVNTFGRRAHPNYPAEFDVEIDVNRDGVSDYLVFNQEDGGFGVTGTNVVKVFNFATGELAAYFYIDADLQSANAILTVPIDALGMSETTTFNFTVTAFDNYFSGAQTDGFGTMTYTAGRPKFAPTGFLPATVAPRSSIAISTTALPDGDVTSPSQTGLLLMYRQDVGREADIVRLR